MTVFFKYEAQGEDKFVFGKTMVPVYIDKCTLLFKMHNVDHLTHLLMLGTYFIE